MENTILTSEMHIPVHAEDHLRCFQSIQLDIFFLLSVRVAQSSASCFLHPTKSDF